MSEELYQFLLSMSIVLPLVAGIAYLKQIPSSFYPIICVLTLGFINEIVNFLFFRESNAVPMNIYNLIEYLLYCIQFYLWKHIFKRKLSFYLLTIGMVIFWLTDEIFLGKISTFFSFFLIIYPFILVLLAVNQLNYLVANEHGNIIKNPVFIFCIAVIIFYCYRILSEVFYHYAKDNELAANIFSIQMYVNVLFNILLTLVVLCIPKKRTITLR